MSIMVPSAGASRYVQKKGAVSRAILGAFINHLEASGTPTSAIAAYL